MGTLSRVLLWFATCGLVPACALEEVEYATDEAYGINDKNGPWLNEYADADADVLVSAPTWRNATSKYSDFSIRFDPTASRCGSETAWTVQPVGNVADNGVIVGSDLQVDDGSGPRFLAAGETVRFAAWMENGAGMQLPVAVDVTGFGHMAHPHRPDLVWRLLQIRILDAGCTVFNEQVVHLFEAFRAPLTVGAPVTIRRDAVIASAAYFSDQIAGAHTKVGLSAQYPADFAGTKDIVRGCGPNGPPIDGSLLTAHLALALTAATPVATPGAASDAVLAFMTKLGERFRMHAMVKTVTGLVPICYGSGMAMSGQPLERVFGTEIDSNQFDTVMATDLRATNATATTQFYLGTSARRRNAYRDSAESEHREEFARQAAIRAQELPFGARGDWSAITDELAAADAIVAAEALPYGSDSFDGPVQDLMDYSTCGDGLCGSHENIASCPSDCAPPPPPPPPGKIPPPLDPV